MATNEGINFWTDEKLNMAGLTVCAQMLELDQSLGLALQGNDFSNMIVFNFAQVLLAELQTHRGKGDHFVK